MEREDVLTNDKQWQQGHHLHVRYDSYARWNIYPTTLAQRQRVVKPISSPYDQGVYTVLQVERKIGAKLVRFLVDSGALMSIVNFDLIEDVTCLQPVTAMLSAVGANEMPLDIVGETLLPVAVGSSFQTKYSFAVAKRLSVDGLIGADFLIPHSAVLDCANHHLRVLVTIRGTGFPCRVQNLLKAMPLLWFQNNWRFQHEQSV